MVCSKQKGMFKLHLVLTTYNIYDIQKITNFFVCNNIDMSKHRL